MPTTKDSLTLPKDISGETLMLDMLCSNLNDVKVKQAKKKTLQEELKDIDCRLEGAQRYLTVLQADQFSL